jgi:hypothetical protein
LFLLVFFTGNIDVYAQSTPTEGGSCTYSRTNDYGESVSFTGVYYARTTSGPSANFLCAQRDLNALNTLGYQFYDSAGNKLDGSGNITTGDSTSSLQNLRQAARQAARQKDMDSCGITSFSSHMDVCVIKPMVTWLISFLLTFSASMLRMAGYLFDWLIDAMVIQFATTIQGNVGTFITTFWTIFRDLSNIVIIGLFVLIAISIVLGLKEFGDKKLIARVIIIAVLINFSLLFAKLIIDASNLTATQFYNAASTISTKTEPLYCTNQRISQNNNAGPVQVNLNQSPSFNIAQAFLTPLCIQDVWSDSRLAIDAGVGAESGTGKALVYGLVITMMVFGIAAVLFYGCFLLAVRFITLIIIMVTAALAFASYLIPSMAQSQYGWNGWWKELINNALFAPLLMIFLTLTLGIITSVAKGLSAANGSIDKVITATTGISGTDPTSNAWPIIMVYLLGTGLLFASLKITSSIMGKSAVSGKIGGFGASAMSALTGGALIGGNFAASNILQNTRGKNAYNQKVQHEGERDALNSRLLQMKKLNLENTPEFKKTAEDHAALGKKIKAADAISKKDFNFLGSTLGKKVAQAVGKPGIGQLDKSKQGGYNATVARTAKSAEEQAAEHNMTAEQKEKYAQSKIDEGRDAIDSERRRATENLEQIRTDVATAAGADVKKSLDEARTGHAEAEKNMQIVVTEKEANFKKAEQEYSMADLNKDEAAKTQASANLARIRAEKQTAIQSETAKIAQAKRILDGVYTKLKDMDPEKLQKAEQEDVQAEEVKIAKLNDYENPRNLEGIRKKALAVANGHRETMVEHYVEKETSHAGGLLRNDKDFAKNVRSKSVSLLKAKKKEEELKRRAEANGRRYTAPTDETTT